MRLPGILHGDVVQVVSVLEGTADEDGVPTTTEVVHTWSGVSVQQKSSVVQDDQRRTVVTTYRVSGPILSTPPVDGDLIRWRGIEARVTGVPDTRRGRHRINHTSLEMVHTTG